MGSTARNLSDVDPDRVRRTLEVWYRLLSRLRMDDLPIPEIPNRLTMKRATIRKYLRRGVSVFRDMAEVMACDCDDPEFSAYWPQRQDGTPTDARPGSTEKVELLSRRFARGDVLFHPDDRVLCDDGDTV